MTVGPEAQFLSWLSQRGEALISLLPRLPREIFTPEGNLIVQKILNNEPVRAEAEPFHDVDAAAYLQDQVLALLGREMGKAQKTHSIDRVIWATEVLEECRTLTQPPQLLSFDTIVLNPREVIATGIAGLDLQIQGLARGDLGICAAPPGRRKTQTMINFAVNAALDQRKVLYITVADQSYMELVPRIDSCILEEPCPVNADATFLMQRHERAIKSLPGLLWISDFIMVINDFKKKKENLEERVTRSIPKEYMGHIIDEERKEEK
mgnify:CR=1 FL=1